MGTTDRIPGFAVCARCGIRRRLESCIRCGLLVCADCRGGRRCAVCYHESLAATRRAQRSARLRELGRRAAVIALVAASGATGLGAALLPDGPLCAGLATPGPIAVRMLPAESPQMVTLEAAAWGQPLSFRCFDVGDGMTCCIIAPR